MDEKKKLSITKKNFTNLVSFYEENIGFLTSSITDRLAIIVEIYPIEWIFEAISYAKSHDIRAWTFIQNYLENKLVKSNKNYQRKDEMNAESTEFFSTSRSKQDPYQSVVKRTWRR